MTNDGTNMKRRSLTIAAVLAGVVALSATPGFAHGGGGGNGNSGGQSASHDSSQGSANTNGPNSTDRDFGRDRAEDRMSASGLAHAHAIKTSTTNNSGGSSNATAHRWLHGRHHHYGWHG
jgi:hypothetical protein